MTTTNDKTILDFLPELQKALDYAGGTHKPQDVAKRVLDRYAQLWVRGNGLIVTEIDLYPEGPVLNFWLAAGDLDDVLDLLPDIYEWGRGRGCERATMLGRKGWGRVLADDGWGPSSLVHYTKDL